MDRQFEPGGRNELWYADTREQAKASIFEYVEGFYDRARRHTPP